MSTVLAGVHQFVSSNVADDLRTIYGFFGLDATGQDMQALTGMTRSTLSRVLRGEAEDPRRLAHVAVLAAFCREAGKLLDELALQARDPSAMRRWLYAGAVALPDHRVAVPMQALSNPDDAVAVLQAVRMEAATP